VGKTRKDSRDYNENQNQFYVYDTLPFTTSCVDPLSGQLETCKTLGSAPWTIIIECHLRGGLDFYMYGWYSQMKEGKKNVIC